MDKEKIIVNEIETYNRILKTLKNIILAKYKRK